jgi:hypothetical protein
MKNILFFLILYSISAKAFVDTEYIILPEDQNYYDQNEYNLNDDENYFQISQENIEVEETEKTLNALPIFNTEELAEDIFETRQLLDDLLLNSFNQDFQVK